MFCIFFLVPPSYPNNRLRRGDSSMVPKRVFQKHLLGRTVVVDAGTRGIAEVEAKARPHMKNLDRAAAGMLRNRTGAESAIREVSCTEAQ